MLVKHGEDREYVDGLSRTKRQALLILYGQMDGGEWDWDRMAWKRQG